MMINPAPRYQVVGRFSALLISNPEEEWPLCWGGWTSKRVEAVERLHKAEASAIKRVAAGGKPSEWRIEKR